MQSQLEQLNTCRMYLQVTTLAEMTDRTSMHLLLQVLQTHGQTHPNGLDSISHSTLQWPQVCNPTTTSWNFWTQTICTLFMGSATGSRLHNPLGNWTSDYDMTHFWKWCLAPTQCLLYKNQPSMTPCVALLVKSQHQHLTFSATIPTNQAFTWQPVTPTDMHC